MNSTAARRVEDFQRQQDRELAQINREQGRPPSFSTCARQRDAQPKRAALYRTSNCNCRNRKPAARPTLRGEAPRRTEAPQPEVTVDQHAGHVARANALGAGPRRDPLRRDTQCATTSWSAAFAVHRRVA